MEFFKPVFIKYSRISWSSSICMQCTMGDLLHEWKGNHKVVNFGNWFLCQFSPKTYKFLHGAFLTPQELGDIYFFEKKWHARGEKAKNVKRVFFTAKIGAKKLFLWNLWYLLFEHLWKTPSNRRKLHSKSEKYGFCSFS